MWYWGGGVQWWGWLLGTLAMVAFWGVLIWAVWYFVMAVIRRPEGGRPERDRPERDRPEGGRHEGGRSGAADPQHILDERLARGEIDAEEYRRLRELLRERDSQARGDEHRGDEHPVGAGSGSR